MKLIKLNTDHYIIVDGSEIKEGDYIINIQRMHIYPTPVCADDVEYRNRRNDVFKKITHSTQPLDERGYWGKVMPLTLTISEIKELIGEVDVFTVVEQWSKLKEKFVYQYWNKPSFIEGYNQALKDNKGKKWTDEDVIRIVEKSRETGLTAEYLMMTLQPKPEWEVEFVDGKLKLK